MIIFLLFCYCYFYVLPLGTNAAVTGKFRVDEDTGEIITTSTFDYESMTYYDSVVKARDKGTVPYEITRGVRIGITDFNDQNPVFSQSVYDVTTDEGAAVDTSVLQLSATDPDSGITPVFTYAISGGNTAGKYRVDGDILEINSIIDLDTGVGDSAEYELTVTVTDQASPGDLTGTATVYVVVQSTNEHTPVWDAWSPVWTSSTTLYSLAEDAAIDTTVVTVSATDDDYGIGGLLLYSIESVTDSK